MIAKLKGIVDQVGDDWVILDVQGVGYLLSCSSRTLSRLSLGEAAALAVETVVREDAITLFGFADQAEKQWFRLLTTVQGVGAKVGLAILSVLPPDQVAQAIAAQDKTALTRASGVGPKLAARIVSELKDKAGTIAFTPFQPVAAAEGGKAPISAEANDLGPAEDAVSALTNLGYRRLDAVTAVMKVRATAGDAAKTAELIRLALKELAKDLIQ